MYSNIKDSETDLSNHGVFLAQEQKEPSWNGPSQ